MYPKWATWRARESNINSLLVTEERMIWATLLIWTEADNNHLDALRIVPIEMGNTAYGCFEVQKRRDVEIAYQKMSAEEK